MVNKSWLAFAGLWPLFLGSLSILNGNLISFIISSGPWNGTMGLHGGHLPLVFSSILIAEGNGSSNTGCFIEERSVEAWFCKSRRVWGVAARALADISEQAAPDGVNNEVGSVSG